MVEDGEVYNQGWIAYYEDISISACPYPNGPEKDEWEVGWLSASNYASQSEYFGDHWPGMENI